MRKAEKMRVRYGKNVMSAQLLAVSQLEVGTVVRLDRDAWSMVNKWIRPLLQFIGRCPPYARKSASKTVLNRMQFTLHATRPTPHGASRLVQAICAWSVKIRRGPSRHCTDARVYGHTTTVTCVSEYTPYSRSLGQIYTYSCMSSLRLSSPLGSFVSAGRSHWAD